MLLGQPAPMDVSILDSVVKRELALGEPPLLDRARVRGPVHRGPYSEVFRVDLACELAAKVCLDPRTGGPHPAFARRQFDELSRVHAAMGDTGTYRVPRPVRLVPDEAMMLMEWVSGEPLSRRLRAWRPRRVVEAVFHAGAWLARFHEAGPLGRGPLDAAGRLDALDEVVARQAPRLRGAPLFARAREALVAAMPAVDGAPVARSWLHGDYQLDNLLFTGREVFGLDLAFSREGATLQDVGYFLNSLDRFMWLPKGCHLLPLRRRLVAAFVRGYGGDLRDALAGPALAWLRVADVLRIHAIFDGAGRTRFHDRHFLATVQIMLRRLVRGLPPARAARQEVCA